MIELSLIQQCILAHEWVVHNKSCLLTFQVTLLVTNTQDVKTNPNANHWCVQFLVANFLFLRCLRNIVSTTYHLSMHVNEGSNYPKSNSLSF